MYITNKSETYLTECLSRIYFTELSKNNKTTETKIFNMQMVFLNSTLLLYYYYTHY